jgi:hypothetical protein
MSILSVLKYQVVESKSGHKIPKINNIHLHSTYDPRYEAERFVLENEDLLKNNNKVLLLGLGFAYHAQYLVTYLKNLHQENYQILIIEPNLKIVTDCESLGLLPSGNISIFSGIEPNDLFQNEEFLEFLLEKPAILPHPASFNLNSTYFKNLLAFRSDKSLETVIPQIRSPEIKNYLEQFPKEATIDFILDEKISKKDNFEGHLDYFFLLLKNIKERELGRDAKHTNH